MNHPPPPPPRKNPPPPPAARPSKAKEATQKESAKRTAEIAFATPASAPENATEDSTQQPQLPQETYDYSQYYQYYGYPPAAATDPYAQYSTLNADPYAAYYSSAASAIDQSMVFVPAAADIEGEYQEFVQPISNTSLPGLEVNTKGKIKAKVDLTRTIVTAPIRAAGDQVWQDPTMNDWDPNDHRLFVGNLGPEVHDSNLRAAFQQYKSFQRARVVRDRHGEKSKGYGFVSFKDGEDMIAAFRDMNGKYIGNRPCKISKSNWKDRNVSTGRAKKLI